MSFHEDYEKKCHFEMLYITYILSDVFNDNTNTDIHYGGWFLQYRHRFHSSINFFYFGSIIRESVGELFSFFVMVDFSLSRDFLLLRLCLLHLLFSSPSQTPCELLSSSGVRPPLRPASVVRWIPLHLNLSLWNRITKLNQIWLRWSLFGPLSKLCPAVAGVTKNRKVFNCSFLFYEKSKWAHILTAPTWHWVV